MLLHGQRVVPRRLLESGFTFTHPTLEGALRFELGSA
jgi:NAD dependent epimerase/dehydratase family enzyme